jgi:acyl carrier protein
MDSKFIDELGWDSLDMVEVTMALEDEFKFEFPETQIDSFRTPRDIFKFICEHEDVRK